MKDFVYLLMFLFYCFSQFEWYFSRFFGLMNLSEVMCLLLQVLNLVLFLGSMICVLIGEFISFIVSVVCIFLESQKFISWQVRLVFFDLVMMFIMFMLVVWFLVGMVYFSGMLVFISCDQVKCVIGVIQILFCVNSEDNCVLFLVKVIMLFLIERIFCMLVVQLLFLLFQVRLVICRVSGFCVVFMLGSVRWFFSLGFYRFFQDCGVCVLLLWQIRLIEQMVQLMV